jgi:type I restriction enzyme M protein
VKGPTDHLGFLLKPDDVKNKILVPKYYNPELDRRIQSLKPTHELLVMGELMDRGVLSLGTGVEVGKMAYGTGTIPFIRSSDISNWEMKADFKHGVSEEIFDEFSKKANIRAEDILMVRDGTYLIGTTAMVTEYDLPMLFLPRAAFFGAHPRCLGRSRWRA